MSSFRDLSSNVVQYGEGKRFKWTDVNGQLCQFTRKLIDHDVEVIREMVWYVLHSNCPWLLLLVDRPLVEQDVRVTSRPVSDQVLITSPT